MNHNPTRHLSYRTLFKLILIGCVTQPIEVFADELQSHRPAEGSTTVEELLGLDSRAALENARKQVFGSAQGSMNAPTSSELPVLVAIYGTGRNLSAELLIAGRTVIFHSKGKQSVSGIAHGYALERIAPPCVYLVKGQAREIACLEMSAP